MNTVFVIQPYPSYRDLTRLVQLSGYKITDTIKDDGSVYICAPVEGNVEAQVAALPPRGSRRSKVIYWILERPPLDPSKWVKDIDHWDEIWYHDAVFNAVDFPRARLVRVGSDSRLNPFSFRELKTFTFAHMSAPYGRRWHTLHHLPGVTAPNCWGAERDATLAASRFMLNIHQDTRFYQEPLRFALAAAFKLSLLSEELYPQNLPVNMLEQHPLDDLLQAARNWYDSPVQVWPDPDLLYEHLCHTHSFFKNVKQGLE